MTSRNDRAETGRRANRRTASARGQLHKQGNSTSHACITQLVRQGRSCPRAQLDPCTGAAAQLPQQHVLCTARKAFPPRQHAPTACGILCTASPHGEQLGPLKAIGHLLADGGHKHLEREVEGGTSHAAFSLAPPQPGRHAQQDDPAYGALDGVYTAPLATRPVWGMGVAAAAVNRTLTKCCPTNSSPTTPPEMPPTSSLAREPVLEWWRRCECFHE